MPGADPPASASERYAGEGVRVAQQAAVNGVMTTTTRYLLGGLEELTTSGGGIFWEGVTGPRSSTPSLVASGGDSVQSATIWALVGQTPSRCVVRGP